MVMLLEEDIQTKEVLDWKGVHLLHFMGSSCSQKTRIVLGIKSIEWTSHQVDLAANENYGQWFLGVNPRGLVPVLVHDGKVIIESNDIFEYIEEQFPEPPLVPKDLDGESHKLLTEENDLHLDLRALTMRYFFKSDFIHRDAELMNQYKNLGSGTVRGETDAHKDVEIEFFESMHENGITDEQIRTAVSRFREAYDKLNEQLKSSPYLLGENLSIIDIAWYIYSARLIPLGYPLHRFHPKVGVWFDKLDAQPNFNREVQRPAPLIAMQQALHQEQAQEGTSLAEVAGF